MPAMAASSSSPAQGAGAVAVKERAGLAGFVGFVRVRFAFGSVWFWVWHWVWFWFGWVGIGLGAGFGVGFGVGLVWLGSLAGLIQRLRTKTINIGLALFRQCFFFCARAGHSLENLACWVVALCAQEEVVKQKKARVSDWQQKAASDKGHNDL